MKITRTAWAIGAVSALVILVQGCPNRDCTRDSECPENSYCDEDLGYCFRPDDGGSDASTDAGGLDAGTADDAGMSDAGPGPEDRFCESSGWCWDNPRPTGRSHQGIHGSSSSDVWAVGRRSMLRWNGSSWLDYPVEDSDSFIDIWAQSASSAWAVGIEGLIKRWDGTTWAAVSSPTSAHLLDVFGLSASEVWAVGAGGSILRWNGSAWTPENSGVSVDLHRIWGTGANRLWVVGQNGTILRRDESGWSPVNSPTSSDFYGLCGISASDLFAVTASGQLVWSDGNLWSIDRTFSSPLSGIACRGLTDAWVAGEGFMGHWDGDTWTEAPATVGPLLFGLYLPPDAPGSGWGVGQFGEMLRLQGGVWSRFHSDSIGADVTALGGSQANTVLIGTSDGRVLSCAKEGDCDTAFASDAGAISDLTGPETQHPWGIAGENVLLGSAQGWTQRSVGSPLSAISARTVDGGTDEAWVVGEAGVSVCSRTSCSSPFGPEFGRNVAVDGDGAVVSTGSQLFRCTEGGCTEIQISEPVSIRALWSPNSGSVWGACAGGKIVRVVGTAAIVDQLPTTVELLAISGTSESDAWVSGRSGVLLHRTGSNWNLVESGTNQPINAIQAFSSGTVVAGGKNSMLLRYDP